jgi:hypothetical protein
MPILYDATFPWRDFSPHEGLFSVLATVDAPDFTFSDTTVVAGMTYRYRWAARVGSLRSTKEMKIWSPKMEEISPNLPSGKHTKSY